MRLNKISLKQAVAMLAATCTLGTCCIAGSVAWAETGNTTEANTANIETTHAISLSIHKYQGTAGTTNSGGSEITNPQKDTTLKDKKPVEGVEFTLYKVQKDSKDIDLTSPDGWSAIKNIKGTAKPSDYVKDGNNDKNAQHVFTISEVGKGTTNAQGLVKFVKTASNPAVSGEVAVSTLGMHLYVVKETNTTGAKIDNKSVTVTGRVDPFFVTLPLANSTTKTWIYDVHVYPKNDTTNEVPTKTASDPTRMDIAEDSTGNTDGTRITWTIAIPLPAPDEGKKYSAIGFSDKLATGLTFDKVQNVRLVKYNSETGTLITGNDNKKDLTVTTHYTVTNPSTGNQNVLTVELTKPAAASSSTTKTGVEEAYDFYTAANGAKPKQIAKLEAEVVTKVGKDVTDVKNIANTWAGNVTTGNKTTPCDPGQTYGKDDPCYTAPGDTAFYGTLKVIKTDKDNNKPLTGAKFNIYEVTGKKNVSGTQTAYKAADITGLEVSESDGAKNYTLKTSNDNGTKVDSKLVGTTLTTKKVTANSTTEASDSVKLFVRKKSETGVTDKVYCAVETEAPAGYDLLDKPVCYNLVEDSATNKDGNTQTVADMKSTPMSNIVGALPMTGARGLVILTLCGIVGIASTFFYIVMKRRKEQEQE